MAAAVAAILVFLYAHTGISLIAAFNFIDIPSFMIPTALCHDGRLHLRPSCIGIATQRYYYFEIMLAASRRGRISLRPLYWRRVPPSIVVVIASRWHIDDVAVNSSGHCHWNISYQSRPLLSANGYRASRKCIAVISPRLRSSLIITADLCRSPEVIDHAQYIYWPASLVNAATRRCHLI